MKVYFTGVDVITRVNNVENKIYVMIRSEKSLLGKKNIKKIHKEVYNTLIDEFKVEGMIGCNIGKNEYVFDEDNIPEFFNTLSNVYTLKDDTRINF